MKDTATTTTQLRNDGNTTCTIENSIEISGQAQDKFWKTISEEGTFFDDDLLEALHLSNIKPGIVLDVGANIGNHTIYFSRVLKREVIAMEPFPQLFDLLERNIRTNLVADMVEALKVGASDIMRWGKLYSNSENRSKTTLYLERLTSFDDEAMARFVPLDEVDLRGRPPALVKISVEGHEKFVLQGAQNILRHHRPHLLVPTPNQDAMNAIMDVIDPFNYHLAGIFGTGRNALFINGEVFEDAQKSIFEHQRHRARSRFQSSTISYNSHRILEEIDRIQSIASLSFCRSYELQKLNTQLRGSADVEKYISDTVQSEYSRLYYAVEDRKLQKSFTKPTDLRESMKAYRRNPPTMETPAIKKVQFPYMTYTLPEGVPVRVGMAALPDRVPALRVMIDSLIDQVDEICISLNGFYEKPVGFDHPKIKMTLNDNIGDLAKFSFLDDAFKGYYFTCDDDISYPGYYVDSIIYYLEKFKGQVVAGWHGSILKKPFENYYDPRSRRVLTFGSAQHSGQFVDILGTGCIGFDTRVIRPPIEIFERPNMADIYFSLFLKENRFGRYLVPHDRKEAIDLGYLYEGTSISAEGMQDSVSVLNTRAEVNRLVSAQTDWEEMRSPLSDLRGRVLMVGRFDHARWNKGGIYKSCHLMAAQLRQTQYEVTCLEIDTPMNNLLEVLAEGGYELCIVYGGDLLAQDSLTYDLLLSNLDKVSCPVVFNVSYDTSDTRNVEISNMTKSLRSTDGVFVFTESAREAVQGLMSIGKATVFPKTIQLPPIKDGATLPVFAQTKGIFMGDAGKFLDPRITPDFEEILKLMKATFGAENLVFVRQYHTPKEEKYLKGCKILPHSPIVFDEIAKCRVYLHTQKNCTFEMLPVEMLARGTPVVHVDMPQSLNTYVGDKGLKYRTLDEMLAHVTSLNTDEQLWRYKQSKAVFGVQSLTYDVTAFELRNAIEAFSRT